jgi:hypothetical protein
MKTNICLCFLLFVFLTACTAPTPTIAPVPTDTATSTPLPADTPTPTATAVRTPPVLPAQFETSYLNPHDTPHTYIQETCQYLRQKWDSNNSTPGTVVMVIMFHSIVEVVSDPSYILQGNFEILMNDLHSQGFQAITTQQLADFLDHNAKIPSRSVLLIVDDRHHAQFYNENFRPYYDAYGWPVVNAWLSPDDYITQTTYPDNIPLEKEGFVDHQAHGVVHNIPISDAVSDDFILGELNGSITFIQQHFGKTPIAFIWPGGGFTPHAAQLARQAGYRLGFTDLPRGPIMFNWIPLDDAYDPMRPLWIPDGPVNDPRMVLPRFWAPDADKHIDEVRLIGNEAAAYAAQNKATELEYYDIVCAPILGPIP